MDEQRNFRNQVDKTKFYWYMNIEHKTTQKQEEHTMSEIIKMPDGRKKLERLVELMYQTDYGTAEYMCMESEANRLTDAGYSF